MAATKLPNQTTSRFDNYKNALWSTKTHCPKGKNKFCRSMDTSVNVPAKVMSFRLSGTLYEKQYKILASKTQNHGYHAAGREKKLRKLPLHAD